MSKFDTIDFNDPEKDFETFGLRSRTRRDRIKDSRTKKQNKKFYGVDGKSRGKDSKPKDWHDWD